MWIKIKTINSLWIIVDKNKEYIDYIQNVSKIKKILTHVDGDGILYVDRVVDEIFTSMCTILYLNQS